MEHLLDAFACTRTCARAALSQQPLAGQSDKSGQRPIGLEWGSQPTLQGPEGGDGDGVGAGVGPALSQQPLAGQSDKSGQRPIGLEWGSQPMEHLLDAFACTCTCAKAALSQQPLAGQSDKSGQRPIGLEWGSQPTLQGPEGGDGDGVGEGVGPALSQQPLAGQSDKSGQRPIGLEWGSQPMEHSLDAFTARATLASARRSCARPTSSQPSSAAQVPSSARAAAEQTTSALNASLPRAMIQWILLNRG
ncbi:unnamed protein product [Prorocentrum cordatum]|uniref:Uncharacterized protein n=1 Tax=Prorocentrum cordatum TaxID=2364126 RepID=A0ABN9SWZ2_9DINO|nr:unnamed protein product [Polarella glacialis]